MLELDIYHAVMAQAKHDLHRLGFGVARVSGAPSRHGVFRLYEQRSGDVSVSGAAYFVDDEGHAERTRLFRVRAFVGKAGHYLFFPYDDQEALGRHFKRVYTDGQIRDVVEDLGNDPPLESWNGEPVQYELVPI